MEKEYYLSKAFGKLINIIIDPVPIVKFLRTKGNHKTIQEAIDSLSLEELNGLWDILKVSKYSKDPGSIMKELRTNLKSCQKYS